MRKKKETVKTLSALLVFVFVFAAWSRAGSDFDTIDTARLHSMVVDNAYALEGRREMKFTIIDARQKLEYDDAHIFSAISIPETDLVNPIGLLPKDKDILLIVYCNGMNYETSRKWAAKAASAGYTNILIYGEGFPAWKGKKMPTVPLAK